MSTMSRCLRLIVHPVAIQRKVKILSYELFQHRRPLNSLYVHLYIRNAKQNILLTLAVPREQQNQAGVTRTEQLVEWKRVEAGKFCRSYQSLSSNATTVNSRYCGHARCPL